VATALLIVLSILVLGLGFLLLGALRGIQRLNWRVDQLEATTPRRIGREGVAIGGKAPAFELSASDGRVFSPGDFAGRRLLIAFMQVGCGPCETIVPVLHRLAGKRSIGVVAIVHGAADDVREWAAETQAQFPVLIQENWDISKRYEVFATPFAFLLDADGVVLAKGIINSPEYVELLLSDAERRASEAKIARKGPADTATSTSETSPSALVEA
jgi:methylamine dehydrogenase accessory protein MauD